MSTSTTETVLNRHLTAFGDQDMEGIMSDYADDAVVITRDETFRGHGEIQRMFEGLFEEFGKPGAIMELDTQIVEDDYAFIVWHGDTPDNEYGFATDTFHVTDGKIAAQTFTGDITPK